MLTYEQLDSIADSVNPVLLVVTLILPWIPGLRSRIRPIRWLGAVACVLVVVYGMKFVDAAAGIWAMWGGDYSTHSAFAIALVSLWYFPSLRWFIVGIVVFVLYAILMVYQKYHSWADILSSAILIGAVAWVIGAMFLRLRKPASGAI